MLWKKGLNRLFVVISVIALVMGCIIGFEKSNIYQRPEAKDVFSAFNWNDIAINKYYEAARMQIEKNQKFELNGKIINFSDFPGGIKSSDLPNYKKSPPPFNNLVFSEAFPDTMQSKPPKMYNIILHMTFGGLAAFSLCYCGLHSIMFVVIWIYSGFKEK